MTGASQQPFAGISLIKRRETASNPGSIPGSRTNYGDNYTQMTTINIKKEKCTLDDKILKELGYTLKWNVWSKKIEIYWIRS